ncbi:MAG: polyprenyl synthetase family protein [Candidatus Pristimantibacillus lignocellulolyticus]|uniref:Polyprenyl synthetase family protein n=1 Tax=Candidatus Pristimantibacillus lignocellulolyticus TaxID=2994561 RepID=A0A9J6ZH40_9BACL|nr:MAG: polyprenyl synthetase family protein [Candidatus Pristimantibacillus lignocellulolyticus]
MNEELRVHADTYYRMAEQKAAQYFASLFEQVREKTYVPALSDDIQLWKRDHIHRWSWLSFLSRGKRTSDDGGYQRHIQWLNHTGKLDDYLDRSVSYMYMRDLGKAMESPQTQARIQSVAAYIKQRLIHSTDSNQDDQPEFISLAGIYRWAQKEGIETAVIWVIGKLKNVSDHIPEQLNPEHAQRKLIKIIIGVVLHAFEELVDERSPAERAKKLDEAIRLGYSYGLTYPFIDDLLDSQILTVQEKEQYSYIIRVALLTGTVPELSEWNGTNKAMIQFMHAELTEAFEYIKSHQLPETQQLFFEQTYVFFHSQESDRAKVLSNPTYTNEELYIPVIIKSASSRLIARSVLSASDDEGFENRTFFYGIYNQLADDFADMFDDMRDGAVTPYTYYLTYHDQRSDLINPFELYWAVISHLIHKVYHSDRKAREVILDRAINGLKRCKARIGNEKYNSIMEIFACGSPEFKRLVQYMVQHASDVDFLDKLLRDQLVTVLKNNRKEKEEFIETIKMARKQINNNLSIVKSDGMPPMKEILIDAANYSLEGDGKRLRPILTWVMSVQDYGLQAQAIAPLLRSLEYMHTASLIFDDLPTQDNAPTRRGRPTLHQVHNSATAEITGLLLMQKAIQEQASLKSFDAKTVLALIKYSAQTAEDLCMGQVMDLNSKGKVLTLEQLNSICFYKTGIAFEAALVMPAILAQIDEQEITILKKFAYHAGIAFQIKDDLLDVVGDVQLLGKPVGKDMENNSSTFVTILGQEGASKQMWEHYCLAMEVLSKRQRDNVFLKHLLNYMVHRDR